MKSGLKPNKLLWIVMVILVLGFISCNRQSGKSESVNPQSESKIDLPDTLTPVTAKVVQESTENTVGRSEVNDKRQLANSNNNVTDSRHNAITRAVAEVSPAVVSVSVIEEVKEKGQLNYNPFFDFFFKTPDQVHRFKSLGSGFIISPDGYIVTNQHVIGNNPSKVVVTVSGSNSTKSYDAKIIGQDEYADLALLKINTKHKLKYAHFGNSNKAIVGEWCIAMGNPFGLFENGQPSVTVGVVSAVKRDFKPDPGQPRAYLDMIQTDAAINSGNSGGPLVNSLGQVIGINTFIYTGGTSSGFVGLGFAIPSNTVVKIISELKNKGKVSLGFDPGFEVKPITMETVYKYNLPAIQGGVFVYSVNKDGPAYKAGILPGDVLVEIGNERIYSYTHYQALLREFHVGQTVKMVILRNNHLYETSMKLREKIPGKK